MGNQAATDVPARAVSCGSVLVVDDDPAMRLLLRAMLGPLGLSVEEAGDGNEALAKLPAGIDLVMLDVELPGIDGFGIAEKIRERYDHDRLPIIMMTGRSERSSRIRAVEVGVNDFLSKPFDRMEVGVRVKSQLTIKSTRDALLRYQSDLETLVDHRTAALNRVLAENIAAAQRTYEAQLETIHRLALAAELKDPDIAGHVRRVSHWCRIIALAVGLPAPQVKLLTHASPLHDAVDAKDAYTRGHSQRVGDMSVEIGKELGLNPQQLRLIHYGGILHDVGKIGVSSTILTKPGKLTPDEWQQMKAHTLIGAALLAGSPSELLQAGEVIALSHHEKWDGSGYPKGLRGEAIPVFGRICAVADVFDALTTRRVYKAAFENEEAYRILREGRGSHFAVDLVDAFLDHHHEVEEIQRKYHRTPVDLPSSLPGIELWDLPREAETPPGRVASA